MTPESGKQRLDWILSPEPALDLHGPGAGLVVGVLALQGDFREHRLDARAPRRAHARGAPSRPISPGWTAWSSPAARARPSTSSWPPTGSPGPSRPSPPGAASSTAPAPASSPWRATPSRARRRRSASWTSSRAATRSAGRCAASRPTSRCAGLGPAPVRAVFIRAPWIESAGPCVEVLATCQGRIVAAREGGVLVTAFHPELTDDTRLHELFIAHDPPPAGAEAAPDGRLGRLRRRRARPGRRRGRPPLTREVVPPCPGTPSGRPSSTRRARPTPGAASCSASSPGPSPSPPVRAAPTPP